MRALRDGRFKVIEAPRPELYDLERDPFEARNLYDERRPLAEALLRRLAAVSDRYGTPERAGDAAVLPADVQERLAALGYVAGGSLASARHRPNRGGDLPDPKDCIGLSFLTPDLPLSGAARGRDRTGLMSSRRIRSVLIVMLSAALSCTREPSISDEAYASPLPPFTSPLRRCRPVRTCLHGATWSD